MSTRWVVPVLLLIAGAAQANKAEVKEFCENLVGNHYVLRISVVKIFEGFKNTDATNIYPTGEVIYRKSHTITQDAVVFGSEIGRQALAKSKDWYISLLKPGTEVLIHRYEVKKTEVQIEFTQQSGRDKKDYLELPMQTVRLKFDVGYTLAGVQKAFARGFAESKIDAVIAIHAGMSELEIIDVAGMPNLRLILPSKTILYFDTMKLVLEEGLLTDGF